MLLASFPHPLIHYLICIHMELIITGYCVYITVKNEWKALKCKPSAQVMQIAYSNTEHLVESEDTRHNIIMKKQFVYS